MSIYAYTGLPGSGKSFDVVKNQILPALKAGRHVVTNLPVHLDEIKAIAPEGVLTEFPTEQVQAAPELIDQYAVAGCVLVLDEVWRLWPSGQKANQVPEPYRKLLAEHRHMVDEAGNAMQIVLVTQDLAQIAAFARQLVEQTFHHTKLTHLGATGSYRIDVYQGPQSGPNPPRQARLREVFGRYDPAIFKLYQSHTMSASGKAGANEKTMDGRANVWKRPIIWVGLAASVAAVAWGVPALHGLIPKKGGADPRVANSISASGQPGTAVKGPMGGSSAPVAVWHVSGFIDGQDPVVFIARGSETRTLSLERFCERVIGEWPVCQWEGLEVSRYGVAAIRRNAEPLAPPVAVR